MKDYITILKTKTDYLTKRYFLDEKHEIAQKSYGKHYLFKPYKINVNNIEHLYKILQVLQHEKNCCVIRGKPINGYKDEWIIRRLRYCHEKNEYPTFEQDDDGHNWIHVDVDDFPIRQGIKPEKRIETIICENLPQEFHNSSYVYQWSASAGRQFDKTFKTFEEEWDNVSVHLWFWSEQKYTDKEFELWARGTDLVDDSMFRSVQLNYTATPIFEDNIEDHIPNRIGFVKKSSDVVVVDPATVPNPANYYTIQKTQNNYSGNGVPNFKIGGQYQEFLDQIGNPRFHKPILQAMMSFISQTTHEADMNILFNDIIERLNNSGNLSKQQTYNNLNYLIKRLQDAYKVASHNPYGIDCVPKTAKERLQLAIKKGYGKYNKKGK